MTDLPTLRDAPQLNCPLPAGSTPRDAMGMAEDVRHAIGEGCALIEDLVLRMTFNAMAREVELDESLTEALHDAYVQPYMDGESILNGQYALVVGGFADDMATLATLLSEWEPVAHVFKELHETTQAIDHRMGGLADESLNRLRGWQSTVTAS